MHVCIDADVLDRSHRSAHAVTDLRAFERRSGRCRARHQPVTRSHHDLAVGADVNEGVELARRDDLERALHEGVAVTGVELEAAMGRSLVQAVQIWFDDSIQLLAASAPSIQPHHSS